MIYFKYNCAFANLVFQLFTNLITDLNSTHLFKMYVSVGVIYLKPIAASICD